MDIFLLILGIILIVLGLAGCILPVIPGPPVSFAGLLLLRFTRFVEVQRADQFDKILWIMAIAAILVTILDYIVPVWGTKRFGGSRSGTVGAAVGLVIGLFFAPLGLILGPFLGAVAGEMLAGKDNSSSLRCVFFRRENMRCLFKPSDGMGVIIHGNISVYEPDGLYQLYVAEMEPAGMGSLFLAFEQLKQKLEAEAESDIRRGRVESFDSVEELFDEMEKKPQAHKDGEIQKKRS